MEIQKLDKEVAHSKEKILKEQARLRRLERQRQEEENAKILTAARATAQELNLNAEQLIELIGKARKEQA